MSDLYDRKVYDNRELSWLKFNERVLEEAYDDKTPLFERLRFASIFCSNLDEFFMVRVGRLTDRASEGDNDIDNKTALLPSEQLDIILPRVRKMTEDLERVFSKTNEELAKIGVTYVPLSKADSINEKNALTDSYFEDTLLPTLSPHISESFPDKDIFENGRIYLVLMLKRMGQEFFAAVKCPDDRLVASCGGSKIVYRLAEEIVFENAERLFQNYTVCEKALVRVTRSVSLDPDREITPDEDYRIAMQKLIFKRSKLPPVRVQLFGGVSELFKCRLLYALELSDKRLFEQKTPLDLSYCERIAALITDRSGLFFEPRSPQIPKNISQSEPISVQAKRQDILLTYPYEDFGQFLRLLNEAACDEAVTEINITLYRVAKGSEVVKALCKAAQNGKQVNVYIELRARSDEQRNLDCSYLLERSGCRVVCGFPGFKVHSKLCLIKRRDESCEGGESFTVQIGTGNYNESTARKYADLTLITSDNEIAKGAEEFFARLMRLTLPDVDNGKLIFSPTNLKKTVLSLIDREILTARSGLCGYIGIKCNGLTDKDMIDALIEASRAGVKIDLIVRGVCCLVPGIEGLTENIRIASIVGRYLEHSRIYIFGRGNGGSVYISSADLMTRNTERRIEAAALLTGDVKNEVLKLFDSQLADTEKSRVMRSDKSYARIPIDDRVLPYDSQRARFIAAYSDASGRKPEKAAAAAAPASAEIAVKDSARSPKKGLFARIAAFFRRRRRRS